MQLFRFSFILAGFNLCILSGLASQATADTHPTRRTCVDVVKAAKEKEKEILLKGGMISGSFIPSCNKDGSVCTLLAVDYNRCS